MIQFNVKIPTAGRLTSAEEERVVWAIYNALTATLPTKVGDIDRLHLNKIIVNRS